MKVQVGQILQSHAGPADDYFYEAIVCIAEHNEEGSLGFVVNRLHPRTLNQLVEFSHLPSFPLYEGGPVDHDHLYFIHRCPNIIEGGNLVKESFYFGGNFVQIIQAISEETISRADVRIFVGYCGWDAGELEAEIEKNEWLPATFNVFNY